ncbi:MAG: glycoside hydrolase family 3 N-terminal domain-containing protein [Chitinophagia bacterium]|jgi:beta-glucosidase-like glycosyl hydrolase/CubicO group peptidase (beta-lactamase class C family)
MPNIKSTLTTLFLFFAVVSFSQSFYTESRASKKWVRKQFRKLSKDERIAQLMIIRAHSNLGADHIEQVTELISKYNVGGLCFFQGGPVRQAKLTNFYQSISKTPLMITTDAEWGLGMRLDSVIPFPRQLMQGAGADESVIYEIGKAVGQQCKRMGIQVNYAPVVDINNNPLNPVINDRSFGEDKYRVTRMAIAYTKGIQEQGVMGTVKHFPGHGDVSVDSHKDLPVINKTREQLEQLELYPFRELIKAGIGSVMIAHLSVPAIDTSAHLPSSLSPQHINGLLRKDLGFTGISFTDALEMQGVTKYYPKGEAALRSIIAGNDLLCLPGDVPGTIAAVHQAIEKGEITWDEINAKVKKVLLVKYNLGLQKVDSIAYDGLIDDLNAATNPIRKKISEESITLLKKDNPNIFPLTSHQRIAYISVGAPGENTLSTALKTNYHADVYLFGSKSSIGKQLMDDQTGVTTIEKTDSTAVEQLLSTLQQKGYDKIIIGLHNYNRRPANQFGLSAPSLYLLNALQRYQHLTLVFGNPYAIQYLQKPQNLLACYEDDDLTQQAAYDILTGKIGAKGKLPVTINDSFPVGNGLSWHPYFAPVNAASVGMNESKLVSIDSIAQAAIDKKAFPGCVILVAKNGALVYNKAFGHTDFSKQQKITTDHVFDLASVTKISATTVSIMKLFEEGKIDLQQTLGHYLPWMKGTNKANLTLRQILLHEAGLVPFITFYKELVDTATKQLLPGNFTSIPDADHRFRVASNMYLRNDWQDTIQARIAGSPLGKEGKYVYSDNDFILLGKIVETVSGKSLSEYAAENFYKPLQMNSTGFNPTERIQENLLVPTEKDDFFRHQLIKGDVHDEGAALMGGIAGHAGLFSNAYDLAQLYQLLLNNGTLNGIRLFQPATIQLFTSYGSPNSRRGLGFDKPEKDNATRKDPYPSISAPPETYGHTGFTGICVWADPVNNLLFIFMSNRVNPTRNNNLLSQMNVRSNIQDAIYQAIQH